MGDTEIDCAALKMKTVTCHSVSNTPQILIILMRAVSGYDQYLTFFADGVLDLAKKVDNFWINGFYLIGIMTPHEIVDLIHGIRIVGAGRIIFNIKPFAGMDVIKIEYSLLFFNPEDFSAVAGKSKKRHGYQEIPSRDHCFAIPPQNLSCLNTTAPCQALGATMPASDFLIIRRGRILNCASHHTNPSL
jgi:hypothetical protein